MSASLESAGLLEIMETQKRNREVRQEWREFTMRCVEDRSVVEGNARESTTRARSWMAGMERKERRSEMKRKESMIGGMAALASLAWRKAAITSTVYGSDSHPLITSYRTSVSSRHTHCTAMRAMDSRALATPSATFRTNTARMRRNARARRTMPPGVFMCASMESEEWEEFRYGEVGVLEKG